jgi:hypothetical protein
MGDLSYLGKTLDQADTSAYHRDRGEDLNVTRDAPKNLRYMALEADAEYVYVFQNGEWFHSSITRNGGDRRLSEIAGLTGYLSQV